MHVRKLLELIISGLNETYSSVKFWRWKGRENMEGGGAWDGLIACKMNAMYMFTMLGSPI